jgi:KDO2-lipid IV(A) lauroyltransferase
MKILLALIWVLHWLPLPVLGRIGKAIGSVLFVVMRHRRHITLTNLKLCLPHLTEAERLQIARAHFQGYTRSILERGILWWASPARLQRLIQIEPAVPLQQIAQHPTILLCPHFVCLEVAGVAITMATPACSIYTRQRNKVFDEALRKGRLRFTPDASNLMARDAGVKPIMRAMKSGRPFLMLPDMDFGARDSVFVPFFGIPAATLTAPARLTSATHGQVIPVVTRFLPDYQGWKVIFYPPWDDYPGADMEAATRRMNAFIEARVLEAPPEYFWSHKRFKTRPPGMPGFYDHS